MLRASAAGRAFALQGIQGWHQQDLGLQASKDMPEATQGHDGGSEHPSGIAWHSMQQMLVLVLPLCSAVHE